MRAEHDERLRAEASMSPERERCMLEPRRPLEIVAGFQNDAWDT